ncbi:hypothetical protein SCHPADRAFT_661876 [Schizopora paradoxa]|uniref:Uncharacterized protein n=1 Tax=Schizopora paradoxa TaxID=27342 RepID=A0A0H2RQT0_9AGAM|nr:hypothetical protein SCHPADRAFT_661876 [Schizopora paradoxa]
MSPPPLISDIAERILRDQRLANLIATTVTRIVEEKMKDLSAQSAVTGCIDVKNSDAQISVRASYTSDVLRNPGDDLDNVSRGFSVSVAATVRNLSSENAMHWLHVENAYSRIVQTGLA